MDTNELLEIGENLSILNGKSLIEYYNEKYDCFYIRNEHTWNDRNEFLKLLNIFESRCCNNFKKFQFLSIISKDYVAFNEFKQQSEILKNDEEIETYFNTVLNFEHSYLEQLGFLRDVIHDLDIRFCGLKTSLEENDDKIRSLESFQSLYENYDRKELSRCINFINDHGGF